MADREVQRRLTAILAADVVGYTRLMEEDTEGTVAAWQAARADVIRPQSISYSGKLVKLTGDGFLIEFPTVQDAVNCAIAMQQELTSSILDFRIGVNLGDIIDDGEDIHGEGVNVAARLEGLAEPGGICISGDVYNQVRNRIDANYEDCGEQKVKNVSAPVRMFAIRNETVAARESETSNRDVGPEPVAANVEVSAPVKVIDGRPAIAVLPFDNMSDDPEQEFFADGLTEDIITTLSKIDELFVVSRNSVFTYKGHATKLGEVGRDLGVQYVLEGSVRKAGNRIRITAQLIEANDDRHLWADRFDRELEDIFAIQDEITLKIVTEMQVELTEGEQAKLRYTTTDNIEAWNEYIKGMALFRHVNADNYRLAKECFEKALEHDPDAGAFHAMLAWVYGREGRFHWGQNDEETHAAAKHHADRSLELDPGNADAYGALGFWHMLQLQHDDGIAMFRKATKLAPSHADTHAFFAVLLTFSEQPDEAIREIQTAMRFNPLYPAWYLGGLGHAYRYAGQYDKAIEALRRFGERSPGYGHADIVLCYLDMGDDAKARQEADHLLTARPYFTVDEWAGTQQCRDRSRLDRDVEGLRRIGLI